MASTHRRETISKSVNSDCRPVDPDRSRKWGHTEPTRVLRTRQLGTDTHQIAVDRRLVIQRLMYPLSVIKQLDVLKYLRSSLIPSLKVTMMDNSFFNELKKL